ncbi:MAG TPA: hypothetical protein PK156_15875 [Polyangium sp.]|nr:hypothetical protein [Polyangium sp.]
MKRILIVGAALFALAGCSSGEVKLGVDVAPIQIASKSTTTDSRVDDQFSLKRVRLLVAHAKIGYAGGRDCGGSEGTDIGPTVVDLTADEIANGAHREFDLGELPSGTYRGAEIEIAPIDEGQEASDEVFADFQKTGASLLVEGTYLGNPFTFSGRWLAEQGTDGEVEIAEGKPLSLAMTVDTSTWFKDTNSAVLDPSDAAQHDALSLAICHSLDTQPQLAPPTDTGGDPHKGPRFGHGGGGGEVHCVEGTP